MLRTASMIAAVVGGLGSNILMLMSGLRPPVFLLVLFVGWVSLPFAALLVAVLISRRWQPSSRFTACMGTLAIVSFSLAAYGWVLIDRPASRPAFPYVAVPIGSWVAILIAVSVARLKSHRAQSTDSASRNDLN